MLFFVVLTGFCVVGLIGQETTVPANTCKENETFYECAPCETTCANLYLHQPCPKICIPGCRCNSGLAREKNGTCINEIDCPKSEIKCPINAELSNCTNPCSEPSCKKLFYIPGSSKMCPLFCKRGCACKKGFIIDDINNRGCRPESKCPKTIKCEEGQIFETCGVPKVCFEKEKNITTSATAAVAEKCQPGCFCKNGTVEDFFNESKCIPEDTCPKCDENEVFSSCYDQCPPTCLNPQPDPCKSTDDCPKGCICKPGFVTDNVTGKCVPRTSCEKVCKELNAEYNTCGSPCVKSCDNMDKNATICTLNCVQGCFCNKGFVLNNKRDKCIPEDDCKISYK